MALSLLVEAKMNSEAKNDYLFHFCGLHVIFVHVIFVDRM